MALTQLTPDNTARFRAGEKGYNGVTLTEYFTTTEPEVAAGSVIEIGGSAFEASTDEAGTGFSGIGNNTIVYMYIDSSGNITFSVAVPTWDDAKQGYYNGNERAFAKLYKGIGTAERKEIIESNKRSPRALELLHVYENTTQTPLTASVWNKINLTTISINNIEGASISSSVITLGEGTYKVQGVCALNITQTGASYIRFRNTSDSTSIVGRVVQSQGGGIIDIRNIAVDGLIDIYGTKNFELQVRPAAIASIPAASVSGELSHGADLIIERIR